MILSTVIIKIKRNNYLTQEQAREKKSKGKKTNLAMQLNN